MTEQALQDHGDLSASDRLAIGVEAGAIRLAEFEHHGDLRVARAGEGSPTPSLEGGVLRLPSRYVSRGRHCTIEPLNGARLRVVDHASTNGTRVDGRPVDDYVVAATPCRIELHPFELLVSRQPSGVFETSPLRRDQMISSDLRIDAETGDIRTPSGATVRGLTPVQQQLLETLVQQHPGWISRAELATITGGNGSSDQSVYSQIHLIRRRLDEAEPGAARYLISQRGRGYAVTPRPV